MRRPALLLFSLLLFLAAPGRWLAADLLDSAPKGPSILVLFDGPDREGNPGRLDAMYLGNLLGHFTIHRTIIPVEQYTAGSWKKYDAVFCIIYQKHYRVPDPFLKDAADINRPFCWLGNQPGQLDKFSTLRSHGIAFDRFFEDAPIDKVRYKGRALSKGDPDTNLFRILDPQRAQIVAEAFGPKGMTAPYIIRSGSFWLVADSPFSYSAEDDRYLVFADVLHDILGIDHAEDHRAMIRVEDINAFSDTGQLHAVLDVFRHYHIPFSFGFVPMYVNPNERIYLHLADKPQVVAALKDYVRYGGSPVLHGYTHQHRGITTDDYEFWDDIADRPVRGDSETFANRRLDEAIRESMDAGLYPLTWETPHYAASAVDYRAIRKFFDTTFERRLTEGRLGSDQFFPYPVIDLKGQFVIPESLGYIPIDHASSSGMLRSAEAELVVRDGYASGFVHPFLKPNVIDEVVSGMLKLGYHFVDLKSFPNRVQAGGRIVSNVSGPVEIGGNGRFLTEMTMDANGEVVHRDVREVLPDQPIQLDVAVKPGETFVAFRQNTREPSLWRKIWGLAKGDAGVLQRRFENAFPAHNFPEAYQALILWNPDAVKDELADQSSFFAVISNMGIDIDRRDVEDFSEANLSPFTLVVVPFAAAKKLSPLQVEQISRAIDEGLVLVTDGESPLSQALGIKLASSEPVHHVYDHFFTNQDIRWPDRPSVPWIREPASESVTLYYSERDERRPLVIGGDRGQGKYLFFAPLFDPLSGRGYSRFPDLPFILINDYHIGPLARRSAADAYFDPGFRQNVSIEKLAKMWKRFGIRTIHVAAWHFYDKYAYDYERLIKVAHQNGILVYAWFEWPHVSQRFWNDHPEWREKNAILADAHIDWRYLMNFENPACLDAVLKDTQAFLHKYDWDGINIAEFHFEAMAPSDKSRFTPFNPQVRAQFQKSNGFDPLDLVKEDSPHFWKKDAAALSDFYTYRRALSQKLIETVLSKLSPHVPGSNAPRETILTVIDTLEHPELADYLAIDLASTIRLVNKYDATLQVEDPAVDWSKTPDRYLHLIDQYKKFPLDHPFMVDINVLPVHPETQSGFATAQPVGAETLELWRAASSGGSRVCLYSESTIYESDWEVLPYAMASKAIISREGEDWVINSPQTIELELNQTPRRWFLDDRPWLCYGKNSVLIPSGEHRLSVPRNPAAFINTSDLDIRLLSLTGELLGCESRKRGLEIEYSSKQRCLLVFNKLPFVIFIDDKATTLTALRGDDGFTVIAPPGQHRLRVTSGSAFFYVIQYTSVVAASLIVLFGTVSSGLLVVLVLFIKLNRRTRPLRTQIQERMADPLKRKRPKSGKKEERS